MSAPDPILADAKAVLQAMAAEGDELQRALGGPVPDAMAGWLAAQYALATREHLASLTGAPRWEALHSAVQDLTELRRGDHALQRLCLDREDLEQRRANGLAAREKEFEAWLERPDIREKYFPNKNRVITKETIDRISRELNLL